MMGTTICALAEGTAMPMLGFLKKFRRELEEYVRTNGKSSTGRLALSALAPSVSGGPARAATGQTSAH